MREVAKKDLWNFQFQPDLKWTWGVDLDSADLVDLARAAYNNQKDMTHSGYDTELADGSKTGADSPDPVLLSSYEGAVFNPLSVDVMPIPLLAKEDIPDIFNFYPLCKHQNPPSELAEVLEHHYICQACSRGHNIHFQPVLQRLSTPDLDITTFSVPAPPTGH